MLLFEKQTPSPVFFYLLYFTMFDNPLYGSILSLPKHYET